MTPIWSVCWVMSAVVVLMTMTTLVSSETTARICSTTVMPSTVS
jgi:uncharacterized membrane protein